ncbi:hypothetical protein EG329_010538 [Mollisiaceae sp. DMI_Dod_QoI]|nr:hypothetical protein EG329_010538 [Helotiales sp. DMI_Dod_QoI]
MPSLFAEEIASTRLTTLLLTSMGFDIASSSFDKAEDGVFFWALYPLQAPEKNKEILTN